MFYLLQSFDVLYADDRLGFLRVGITDVHPNDKRPDITNYELCNNVEGFLEMGKHRTVECDTMGRYLIVQIKALLSSLHLAEVQVCTGT